MRGRSIASNCMRRKHGPMCMLEVGATLLDSAITVSYDFYSTLTRVEQPGSS
jgi:hypothetical protein